MTQKETQETIKVLESMADYYWQTSLHYRSKDDILRQEINRAIADAFYRAAQIVKHGPDKVEVLKTTGRFANLKYREIPEDVTN